jgi:4-amino-4-deoxy-L-arabinose transferase-like glycosyltransferase
VLAYEGDPELAILLTALLVVPVVLVIVASRFTIASAAYALPVVVPLAALVGVAADRALVAGSTSARRWTSRFAVAAIFVSQVNDLVLYHTFYNGLKPRWRSALAYVAQHRRTGDVILASEGDVAQYYLGRTNVGWFKPSAPAREQWNSTSESDGVWYVLYTAETGPLAIPPARLASVRAHSSLRALFSLHYGAKDRTIGVFYQSPGDDAP